ncbi:hypothetical protein HY772_06785, partial [Candidatus Woesearchaeota archaeon]|nr:hypothetical protein [Candidatus Woesearchaeota archaeon]
NMMSVGFYNEGLTINLKKDLNAPPTPTTVMIDTQITAIRVERIVAEKAGVAVGMDLGLADMNANILGALAWAQTAPMADVFLKWNVITGGDKSVKTDISATLGYRTLMIAAQDPDAGALDFVNTVNNLGGFWLSLSLGVSF